MAELALIDKEKFNQFAFMVYVEIGRARKKFPDNAGSMCALTEEVGELAKALLDEDSSRILAEAVQVACMAFRVASEGDRTLNEYRKTRGQKHHPEET